MKLKTRKTQYNNRKAADTAMSLSELSCELESLRALVLRFCENYLHNTHDAQEACQDTLFKVYQAYAKFQGKSSLKTWVMKIASNTCASFYRSNAKYRNTLTEDEFQFEDEVKVTPEQTSDFNSLIDPLNVQEKNILCFHFIKGMQFTEIAQHLELNKSTVKMCYYRALGKFQLDAMAA